MPKVAIKKSNPKPQSKHLTSSISTLGRAVSFLDTLANNERIIGPQYSNKTFGLTRINKILSELGNPHKDFKTAHIAGTKGKGSTAVMLHEMLRAAGYRVGLYTSPHLLDVRERIMIDGHAISEAAFAKSIAAVANAARKAKVADPTYFEVLTAAAFVYFADKGANLAVLETGLGGRLDATNVVTPEVVGITSISYDHIAQLGSTLESIAREKAGIIKKGVPVISATQPENVRAVLREIAASMNSPLRFADENVEFSYRFEHSRVVGRHARICLTTPTSKYEHVHVPLPGEHQAINCSIALGMLDILKSRGLEIDDAAAVAGLANVNLPGRMQIISENPRVLVDGAHNAASVDALMRAIGQNITYDSMVVIFACQRDKDISGMIRRIQVGADKVIFTSTGSRRTAEPAELAAQYIEHSGKMAQVARNLNEAMEIAMRAISREDLICITGSFYLVAEAMKRFGVKTI